MDSNFTLNTELFPKSLIEVLSYRCHFCDLVWFKVSKPSLWFSSLHKVAAPTLLEAYVQRCCLLPSVGLVAFRSSPFQIPLNKNTTFTVCRGWRYCPAQLPSILNLPFSGDLFEKLLSWQLGVCKVRTKSGLNIMNFWIRFLKNWRQDSLFLALIIIRIILFWILKILDLYAELPQKITPIIYNITYIVNMFFT